MLACTGGSTGWRLRRGRDRADRGQADRAGRGHQAGPDGQAAPVRRVPSAERHRPGRVRGGCRAPAPALDTAMRRLSGAANHSKLWLSIAAGLALTGPAGRRSAVRGVLAIGVTSALVNIGVKSLSEEDDESSRQRQGGSCPRPGRARPRPARGDEQERRRGGDEQTKSALTRILLREGFGFEATGRSSDSGLPPRRLPGQWPVASRRGSVSPHSGGTVPDLHRVPLPLAFVAEPIMAPRWLSRAVSALGPGRSLGGASSSPSRRSRRLATGLGTWDTSCARPRT